MKEKKYIFLFLYFSFSFLGCVSAKYASMSDLDKGKTFILNMIHTIGTAPTSKLVGSIFSKKTNHAYFVDQVYLFQNSKNISFLDNKGLPYTQSNLTISEIGKNQKIEVDAYKTDDAFTKDLIGYSTIDLDMDSDILYCFVTEVDAENDLAHLDVYKLQRSELVKILNTDTNDAFKFAEEIYPLITKSEKISNLNFSKPKN